MRKYLKAAGKKGRLEELRMVPVILAFIISISLGKLRIFWIKINYTFVSEASLSKQQIHPHFSMSHNNLVQLL